MRMNQPLHIAIYGNIGTGKTMLAHALQKLLQEHGLVVYVMDDTQGIDMPHATIENMQGRKVLITTLPIDSLPPGWE